MSMIVNNPNGGGGQVISTGQPFKLRLPKKKPAEATEPVDGAATDDAESADGTTSDETGTPAAADDPDEG